MPPASLVRAKLENLLINLHNPRYDPRSNQREALATITIDQGAKLYNLAEDIVVKGMNPTELLMVTPAGEGGHYVVLEGNRRVAALKLLSSPSLVKSLELPTGLTKKYIALIDSAKGILPSELLCVIVPPEDAKYWIRLKHTGENEGVGIVSWDGRARHRFRGESPALQAIERVESSKLLDDATRALLPKISITNIERILNTPDARRLLGVDVKNDKLSLRAPIGAALGRLALIVTDVANRTVRVSDLDSKEQRVNYAKKIIGRPLPKPTAPTSGRPVAAGAESVPVRPIPPYRVSIMPRNFKLRIPQTRINQIYHELQKLNTEIFLNSSAVMLRVFVEFSVDDYAKRRGISLSVSPKGPKVEKELSEARDLSLRQKLIIVADYVEKKGVCTREELHGVRTLISSHTHILSVKTLNAYVHNPNYNPTASELRSNWDSIQVFIERLWLK